MQRAAVTTLAIVLAALSGACRPSAGPPIPPAPPEQVATPPLTAPPPPLTAPPLRLPRDLAIAGYDLTLTIDPGEASTRGTVVISGQVVQPTTVVWLHAQDLTIDGVEVTGAAGEVAAEAVTGVAEGRLAIRTTTPLPPGPATITIRFQAKVGDQVSEGTFHQQVGDDWYVFTHHEPLDARRSFPCLDEPDVKVPWRLTVDVPVGSIALTNAPVAEKTSHGDRTRFRFEATPPLPSYLVAYAAGPFELVDAGTSAGGAPLRIVTTRGRAGDAAYAAAQMPRVLTALEDWFGSRYPFAKLDSLAIPSTVGFSAMENPGLITYRESLLLVPDAAPDGRRRRMVAVAGHELAHMWFGDLVTPMWWDDLWLNEAFASWLPRKVLPPLYPGWTADEDRVDSREDALRADALVSARRIHQPIEGEGDIVTAFDRITYSKGSAVLSMMETWIGPDRFQAGVRAYLAAHARGNATAADFVAAVAAQAPDLDVTTAFTGFLDQAGAPRIGVTVDCRRRAPPLIVLDQRRFVPLGATTASGDPPAWNVPVCVRAGVGAGSTRICTVLTGGAGSVEVPDCPRWVWPNADATGYYRAGLDRVGWEALRRHGWKHLSAAEQTAAAFDLSAAVSAGEVDIDEMLELMPLLIKSERRIPVALAADLVRTVDPWVPDARRAAFQAWVRRRFGPLARRLSWAPGPRDSIDRQRLRAAVVPLVAEQGADPRLTREAVERARRWDSLPEGARASLLQVAVRAEPALHDTFLAALRTTDDRVLRNDLVTALGSVPEPARMGAALALAADPKFDLYDVRFMVETAIERADTRAVAQQILTANLDALIARLPNDSPVRLIAILGAGCDADAIAPTRARLTAKLGHYPGATRILDQTMEQVSQCAARRARVTPVLERWLARAR